MAIIKLKSMSGEIFEVEEKVARVSSTIKTMLDDLGFNENDTEPIPVTKVPSHILRLVIKWAEQHADDPAPVQYEDDDQRRANFVIPEWDRKFLQLDKSTLFHLITAANFMDVKGLLDMASKTVADMIIGNTVEEVRKQFNIKNDYTEEEIADIQEKNDWCEERK